jgi:HEAT repeat protein
VRRHWKLLGVLAGLALIVTVTINSCGKAEPIFRDLSLTQWCLQYEANQGHEDDRSKLKRDEAREAIRAIGTNGIPIALRMLRSEDSYRMDLARRIVRIRHLERLADFVEPSYPFQTTSYFQALGELGGPAVPELTRLLNANTNLIHVHRYSWCLAAIGKPALPSLLAALSRPELDYRNEITCWLSGDTFDFGAEINQAAPILVKLCCDPYHEVAGQSVRALGRMTIDTERLLPALTNALNHHSPFVRSEAARSLGRLPGSKGIAIPALRAALADPAEKTRQAATNALLMFAPEALTNSPTR